MRLKRMFERIGKLERGVLLVKDTPEFARELLWFLDRYPMDVPHASDRALLEKRRAEHIASEEAVHHVLFNPDYKPPTFELALPPRDYQSIAADLALRTGQLLVADEVGVGKTAVGIIVATRCLPACVVVPTHLPRQWKEQFEKFAPSLRVLIIKSGRSVTRELLDQYDVVILNYHKLQKWAGVIATKTRAVIFDEAQELRHAYSGKKDEKTHKYEGAELLAQYAEVRVGLSATPIFNYGGELFNVMEVIAPGALGSDAEFKREWCKGSVGGKALVEDPKAFGTYLRDQGLMIRRTRKDIGRELPPVQRIVHEIDADLGELDKVESDAAELARSILTAGGEKTNLERMQNAAEFDMLVRRATGLAKAAAVADFVRILVDSGEKVVLFGWHHAVYDVWREKLKDLYPVFFTGKETEPQKAIAKGSFISGTSRVMVMSLRSGVGVDGLQKASSVCVFGELDWSPKVHEQDEGRLWRDGALGNVVSYYLVADVGSDPVVRDVLQLKESQSHGIVDPGADLVVEQQTDPNHIKRLAAAYLQRQGRAA